jgi:UDP-glucose 4-epimerase
VADVSKIEKALSFKTQHDLESILQSAWDFS